MILMAAMNPAALAWGPKFCAMTLNVLVAGFRGTVYCSPLDHCGGEGDLPTNFPLTYKSKLLSTARRMAAVLAVLPLAVAKVFLNPTIPAGVLEAAPDVDQIQDPAERFRGVGSVGAIVRLLPHDPDPNGAPAVAATNWVVSAGVGKSDGIAVVAAQLESENILSTDPSV